MPYDIGSVLSAIARTFAGWLCFFLCPKVKVDVVAWKTSFRYAVKVLVFSVIWLIAGMAFMFGGMVLLTAGRRGGSPTLVVAVILFAVGYLIIYLGIIMAIFRYLPEALAEKVKGY